MSTARNTLPSLRWIDPTRVCGWCGALFLLTDDSGDRLYCAACDAIATAAVRARADERRGRRVGFALLLLLGGKRWPEATPRDAGAYLAALRRDPCAYCGAPASELDHVTPIGRGGVRTKKAHVAEWANLAGACRACNYRKSDRSLLGHLLAREVERIGCA